MAYGGVPQPGTVEIDLHGKNVYQARVALDSALRRANGSVYRIRAIHGYQSGTALKTLVQEYASHPRVKEIQQVNPGCTELILRKD